MIQPESSILRVLKNNAVVGAAFLVADHLIVTCARVDAVGDRVEEVLIFSNKLARGVERSMYYRDFQIR